MKRIFILLLTILLRHSPAKANVCNINANLPEPMKDYVLTFKDGTTMFEEDDQKVFEISTPQADISITININNKTPKPITKPITIKKPCKGTSVSKPVIKKVTPKPCKGESISTKSKPVITSLKNKSDPGLASGPQIKKEKD